MNRKKTLLLISLLFSYAYTNAQQAPVGKITARVTDEHHQPIGFATLSLLRAADSSHVASASTSETGDFAITAPQGTYLIAIGYLGFEKMIRGPFTISPDHLIYQLGELALRSSAKQLSGVTISYKKPLIDRQADKTVLNIEGNAIAAGNTALEILQKSPGVTINQDGGFSLQGKQGATVMLDGKLTYLSGQDLTNLLSAMQGVEIQSIELITNPSSKFDASGTGGIINIKTKKNKIKGTNGTATIGGGIGKYAKENGDLLINHRGDKVNLFAGLSFNHGKSWLDNNIDRINTSDATQTFFNQNGRTIRTRNNYNYKAGLDYMLNANNTIGFLVNGNSTRSNEYGNVLTLIGSHLMETDSLVKANNSTLAKNHNTTYDLNFVSKLDTTGRELSIDATYADYVRNRTDEYDNLYYYTNVGAPYRANNFRNFTPAVINIEALKADYTYPLSKSAKFAAGFKSSFVKTDNNSLFQNMLGSDWQNDDVRSDHFIYKENINALYGNLQKDFNKTTIQLGLRAEQTNSTGNSVATGNKVANHYLNFFPSLFIRRALSANNDIGFSYTRRIDRPDYSALNPFIKYIDLYSYNVGNPYLKPQFTHSLEVNYAYKKTFYISLGYTNTSNVISQIVTSDTVRKTLFTKPDNIAKYSSLNLDITAPVHFTEWWSAESEFNAFYGRFTSPNLLGAPYSSGRAVFNFHVSNTITVNPTLNVELSGDYRTKGLEGTFDISSQYRMDAGLSKSFMNKNLILKASLSDALNSFKLVTNSTLPAQHYNNYIKAESQIFRIACSYHFGSTAVKATDQRKKGSQEEQNRVNQ